MGVFVAWNLLFTRKKMAVRGIPAFEFHFFVLGKFEKKFFI